MPAVTVGNPVAHTRAIELQRQVAYHWLSSLFSRRQAENTASFRDQHQLFGLNVRGNNDPISRKNLQNTPNG